MTSVDSQEFRQQMQRVEALIGQIERSTDPATKTAAQDVVRALLDLHGAALAKLLDSLSRAGEPGRAILEDCAGDDLLSSVLLLHGLHPIDLETRVQQALEKVRPYLKNHGGNVELLEVSEAAIHLRMLGSCDGCPSSAETLKGMIEQAIYDAAPDVTAIDVDGATEPAAPAGLVQIGSLPRNGPVPRPTVGQAATL